MIVLVTGILISSMLFMKIMENQNDKSIKDGIVSNAYLVRELVIDKINFHTDENLSQYLKEIKVRLDMRITVIHRSGKVIGDSDANIQSADNHHNRPEVLAALEGKIGIEKRHSITIGEDLLYCAIPYYANDNIGGAIRLSRRLNDINSLKKGIYINTMISLIAGLAVAAVMGYRVSVYISNPIKEMTYMSSKISKGQFDKRILISSKDEIGELSTSINNMAAKLDETINSLKDKNSKMEAILSSVVNGIIAIDNNERVLFMNPAAINILNIREKDTTGKYLLQIIRNNDMDDFLRKIIEKKHFESTEIFINYPEEKNLKIYTNPIKYNDSEDVIGIIIIIQDITEIRKLERVRTEFVANVSHELKTPLTSIKGFAETLRLGALDDHEAALRFLGIIEEEADRLFRLINDILSLSELENKKVKQNRNEINIENLINHVISIMTNQAQNKNISISKDIRLKSNDFIGDNDEIKQMLINLIDNAIKYTQQNGSVFIEAYDNNDNLIITVTDSGIGISKEHIPRLFERFYRVDKARSKRIGGTGLGLAIVKHIVKSYDGRIEVESKVGIGTKFKVILSRKA